MKAERARSAAFSDNRDRCIPSTARSTSVRIAVPAITKIASASIVSRSSAARRARPIVGRGVTAHPHSGWVTQQARNLAIEDRLSGVRFLVHDRDSKFSAPFDEVFRTEGARVIRSPVRAPKANAVAERWGGTVRRECLDHVLIFGAGHLEHVLNDYVAHYNHSRPHRALDLASPTRSDQPDRPVELGDVGRHDVLGGLIHEYFIDAA